MTYERRIGVLGIGNVLTGDDGVGPYLVRRLEATHAFPPEVRLADVGTAGFDLLLHLTELDALIVVDTVRADAPPGSVVTYRREEILDGPVPSRLSPHEPGLREALASAGLFGADLQEVLLVGVVPTSLDLGTHLSPAVRRALPRMRAAVLTELKRLGCEPREREVELEPEIFWETAESAHA